MTFYILYLHRKGDKNEKALKYFYVERNCYKKCLKGHTSNKFIKITTALKVA